MNNHMMAMLRDIAILFPAFLLVFSFRGFMKAFVARWMGDETAYQEGYMTLNPLAHVDIIGLSIILLGVYLLGFLLGGHVPRSMLYIFLIFMGVRWTYSVPFEPRNFKRIKLGATLTIIAGSIGCFLVAYLFLYFQKYMPFERLPIGVAKTLGGISGTVVLLAAYFGVLAMVPIPPFDGGQLLRYLLPYSRQGFVDWLEGYSMYILLALFFLPVVSDIFFGVIHFLGLLIVTLLSYLVI